MWQLFRRLLSVPVAAGFSVSALTGMNGPDIMWWLAWVVAGVGMWTLFEYAMHRFLYHRVPFFEHYHDVHHMTPNVYIGAPPIIGTGLIVLVTFAPFVAFFPLMANGLTVGMLSGYAGYMVIHHACHFWKPVPGTYLYDAWLRHAVHHHHLHDQANFGVTTALWDHVFGTYKRGHHRATRSPPPPCSSDEKPRSSPPFGSA